MRWWQAQLTTSQIEYHKSIEMLLEIQPTLQNDLVILRPLHESDYMPLYQVASDPLIWSQHPCNDRYLEVNFNQFFDESMKSKGALIVIDRQCDEIIGSTRFNRLSTTDKAIE